MNNFYNPITFNMRNTTRIPYLRARGNASSNDAHYSATLPPQSNDTNYNEMSDWDFWNKMTDNDGDSANGYFFDYNNKNWQNNRYLKNLMARALIYGKLSFDPNIIKNYARALQELSKYFDLTSNGYTLKTDSNIDYIKANKALLNFLTQLKLFLGTINRMRKSQSYIDANGNIVHAFEGDSTYDYNPTLAGAKGHYSDFRDDQEMQRDINDAIKWNSARYADDIYNKALASDSNNSGFLSTLSGNSINKNTLAKLWLGADIDTDSLLYKSVVRGSKYWYGKNAKEAEKNWFNKLKDNEKYAYLRWRDSDLAKSIFGADNLLTFDNDKNLYLTDYVNGEGNKDYLDFSNNFYGNYRKSNALLLLLQLPSSNVGFSLQFKQGGKMNKYQEGGKAATAAELVIQALEAALLGDQSGLQKLFGDQKTAQAVVTLLQKEAEEGSEEAVQALKALQLIMGQQKESVATMARKGAKLDYIHRLSTGCPSNSELLYFKKGGRLCRACVKKAEKGIAMANEKINKVIASNMKKYKGITRDQAAGREPITYRGQKFYLDGDGNLILASNKFMHGGYINYFLGGGKLSPGFKDNIKKDVPATTNSNRYSGYMQGKNIKRFTIGKDGKAQIIQNTDSVSRAGSTSYGATHKGEKGR